MDFEAVGLAEADDKNTAVACGTIRREALVRCNQQTALLNSHAPQAGIR